MDPRWRMRCPVWCYGSLYLCYCDTLSMRGGCDCFSAGQFSSSSLPNREVWSFLKAIVSTLILCFQYPGIIPLSNPSLNGEVVCLHISLPFPLGSGNLVCHLLNEVVLPLALF